MDGEMIETKSDLDTLSRNEAKGGYVYTVYKLHVLFQKTENKIQRCSSNWLKLTWNLAGMCLSLLI